MPIVNRKSTSETGRFGEKEVAELVRVQTAAEWRLDF
jgi:hypothetical protein